MSERPRVEDDDIIELNVGGKIMTTYRSTLCQVEDSLLAATFSSDSFEAKYDKNGRVFLDYNPEHFAVVLDYLRAKASNKNREDKPDNKPEIKPDIKPEDKESRNAENKPESFNMFVKHLGLNEMLLPVTVSESFKGSSCRLEEDGAVACGGRAFGQNTYEGGRGVFRIKLKFESLEFNRGAREQMRFGVVQEEAVDAQNTSRRVVLYGWGILGKQLKMYTHAMEGAQARQSISADNHNFKTGDEFDLILDCDEAKLYLNHTNTGEQYYIDLPKWTKYRLCCVIPTHICKIRVVNV